MFPRTSPRRYLLFHTACVVLALCCGQGVCLGQGVIVTDGLLPRPVPIPVPVFAPPIPPRGTYAVKEVRLTGRVKDQVAQIMVQQTFANTSSVVTEGQFLFPVPYQSSISSLTLLVDGKEFPAKLLSAAEARSRYEQIVRSTRDPALLEWIGSGLVQTSVFPIPVGGSRQVQLEYSVVLHRDRQVVDLLLPLAGAKYSSTPLEKLSIDVQIEAGADIKSVYSPTHAINVSRPDARHARITYEKTNETPASDFRVFYDMADGDVGVSVVSYRPLGADGNAEEGYFLLLASPKFAPPATELPKKTVIFVVDQSGSMTGEKMKQARQAARFVLEQLRDGDLFNIVAYQSNVSPYKPELEVCNDQTRAAALAYVDALYEGGGTNIHGALTTALPMLQDPQRPSYVLFLTDGLPTVGEQRELAISAAAKAANRVRARMLTFGVGFDVNSRLLDRLARDNFGASEYVRPQEDIEQAVSRVYRRISTPVLTDVSLAIEGTAQPAGTAMVNRLYPAGSFDLFQGEQLVVVGRYKTSGAAKVKLTGTLGGQSTSIEFPVDFAEPSASASNAFIARLWATRRVGEIIDQIDLSGSNPELIQELTALATKYGILTPYTAFLAEEATPLAVLAGDRARANVSRELERLNETAGRGAISQRAAKGGLQRALSAAPAGAFGSSIPGSGGEKAETILTDALQQVDGSALYKRMGVVTSPETAGIDVTKDESKFLRVTRFSDEYFALLKETTTLENALLSRQLPGEQLLISIGGQAYLIE